MALAVFCKGKKRIFPKWDKHSLHNAPYIRACRQTDIQNLSQGNLLVVRRICKTYHRAICLTSGILAERITEPSTWSGHICEMYHRTICLQSGILAKRLTGQFACSQTYLRNVSPGNLPELRRTCGTYHKVICLK